MGNIGSGELLVIFVLALIVLGPARLPEAVRWFARIVAEVRRISTSFQRELQDAIAIPSEQRAVLENSADVDVPRTMNNAAAPGASATSENPETSNSTPEAGQPGHRETLEDRDPPKN